MKIIIDKKQKALIEKRPIAFATYGKEGINVVALACCKVVSINQILLTDNYMNKTRKNLLENPKVAIAVWSADEKEGYQFKGTAQYITSGEWKEKVDLDPDNEGLAHKAAVLVTVNEIWDLVVPHLIAKE